MSEPLELSVKGMHCDHCEVTVGAALSTAGLEEVEVDWRRGLARGVPTDSFTMERAGEEVSLLGYNVIGESSQAAAAAAAADSAGDEYDLLIIGSGSAAFGAAIKARDLGARVGMIERGTLGGTCVNIGCVPSKALLRAADAYWKAGHSPFAGADTSADRVRLGDLIAQKNGLVDQLRRDKYEDLVEIYGFDVIRGEARFTGPDTVVVDGKEIRAFRFLIATGAAPWVPPIDGLDDTGYLTSTEALDLTEFPEEVIVVGANAIGLELGQVFVHLGSKVTFVEALERVAPFEEPEISAAMTEHLESQGATVLSAAKASAAGRDGDRVWLDVDTATGLVHLEADRLLMATGRRARTGALRLDLAGVDTDASGHVIVDDHLATSNERVYAAGDVTVHPQFVYVAALDGNIAAENALRGSSRKIDFRTMPRVTFTTPAIASVGLTEQQARDAGHPVITSVLPLEVVPRALVDRETKGLIKLVADEAGGHLLGAHIMAEGAGDVIQAAVMALKYRSTIDEIAETFHPYLTMAEGLKLAAQAFGKDVKMLSCCAA